MAVSSRLLAAPSKERPALAAGNSRQRLTRQQARVTTLVACGLSDEEIARRLCVSPGTIDLHVKASIGRLRVHTRAALVALAILTGEIALADICAELRRLGRPVGEPVGERRFSDCNGGAQIAT